MILRRRALPLLALLMPSLARAQSARPTRIIVPYPPGGSNDIIARFFAEALREELGQPVIVENRAGANGNVGAESVARGAADGTTLLLTAPSPLAINESLHRSLPFSPARDFAPIALVASVPIVLMVNPALAARDAAGLIAHARANPGRLSFGSSGIGSTNHLAGEMFRAMAGIEMTHVPYRGAAPAMTDLIAGQIQVMFDNMPAVLPQVREGRVRALAVAGAARAAALPEVPTVAESGLPGFEAAAWFGLAAPSATPAAVRQRLEAASRAVLERPAFRERLAGAGAEPGALFGEGFAGFLVAERAKWGRVVRDSGATAD